MLLVMLAAATMAAAAEAAMATAAVAVATAMQGGQMAVGQQMVLFSTCDCEIVSTWVLHSPLGCINMGVAT